MVETRKPSSPFFPQLQTCKLATSSFSGYSAYSWETEGTEVSIVLLLIIMAVYLI